MNTPDPELTRADVDRTIARNKELIRRSREARLAADQKFALWFMRRYRAALRQLDDA